TASAAPVRATDVPERRRERIPPEGTPGAQGRGSESLMLKVHALSSGYGREPVLRDLSFKLERGSIGCILGPSGCGKTTLLRCIAGFEHVESGTIAAGERLLSSPTEHLPPERRRIGMVFQDYALLPHLTAAENVAFGLHRMSA